MLEAFEMYFEERSASISRRNVTYERVRETTLLVRPDTKNERTSIKKEKIKLTFSWKCEVESPKMT